MAHTLPTHIILNMRHTKEKKQWGRQHATAWGMPATTVFLLSFMLHALYIASTL